MECNVKTVSRIDVKSVLTKTNIPLGGYVANPYVGCAHACKYCFASFMKRFTGHKEPWGEFLDVKYWPPIENPRKYAGEAVLISSVTDPYNPLEEQYRRTRAFLEDMVGSGIKLTISTKSDLVLQDLDLLKKMGNVTVSWSINTLDEAFKDDMDAGVSIERRLTAMKKVYEAGIRTVCFISPIFPGITDVEAIIERVKDCCDFIWLENLNLRGAFKGIITDYIEKTRPELMPLYHSIYTKKDNSYWTDLQEKVHEYADRNGMRFIDNITPDGRSPKGHPAIIDYLYHEQVRGSDNTGRRNL